MKKHVKSLPDTNTVIRYLVRDNEQLFIRAKAFFDKVKTGSTRALILESVIAESIYVLTKIYKVPRKKAAETLVDLLSYKGVSNQDRQELIEALKTFSKHNVDIVDCILCAKALNSDIELFSFDDDLNKLYRSRAS